MRLRQLMFAGVALLVTSVFINLLVTLFIITPGPIQISDTFSSLIAQTKDGEYAKLSTEKNDLEKNVQLQTRKLQQSTGVISKLQDEIQSTKDELVKTRTELDTSDAALEKTKLELEETRTLLNDALAKNEKLVKVDQKKQRKEKQTNCNCDHEPYIKDTMELRAALETEYGFRNGVFGRLIPEATESLTRNVVEIDRVDGKKFSYSTFFEKYVKTQTPVVITNYGSKLFSVNWTLDFISQHCGDEKVKLKHFDPNRKTWGNLYKDRDATIVRDFIEQVKEGTAGNSYLFDWGIPAHCASMLKTYSVPKYFAADYFQRIPDSVWGDGGYKDSWPSLFIGTGDTRSGLHIDAVQSHFWMAMISGHKRWGVVTPDHVPFLYPTLDASTFDIEDIFDVDVTKWPLVSKITIWETILGPGDLIYVPGGSAHQIRNLDTIVSISMNYIDEENFDRSTDLLEDSYPEVVSFMKSPVFRRGCVSKQRDLPWHEYKTYPRDEVNDLFIPSY